MNRQLSNKPDGSGGDAGAPPAASPSALSLLVDAAAHSQIRPGADGTNSKSGLQNGTGGSNNNEGGQGGANGAGAGNNNANLEEQIRQATAARAAETLQQQQGLLSRLGGAAGVFGGGAAGVGAPGVGAPGADPTGGLYHHDLLAQQQQQHLAALSLATDIRTAVAAAQLRQAAQFGNNDLLLARAAAIQEQLLPGGGQGPAPGAPGSNPLDNSLQDQLDLQRLQQLERQHLLAGLANAGGGAPGLGGLSAVQQLELQESQRQELLGLANGGAGNGGVGGAGNDPNGVAALASLAGRNGANVSSGPAPSADNSQNRGGVSMSSKDATGGQSKDSFQKTPGSVVVPCRARGMPMDHNFKTAYFVIPENVEHGEELICSYFACRNAGIKFRYCTYCKVPVAKRNFRKRHKHGKSTGDEDGEDEGSSTNKEPKSPEKPKALNSADDPSSKINPPSLSESMPNGAAADTSAASDAPSTDGAKAEISDERQGLWNKLLAKRPPTKDGDAVSQWLMEVLSVSDLETPLGQKSEKAGAALSSLTSATSSSNSGSSILKKKRPLPSMGSSNGDSNKEEGDEKGGGFAEWKDRKKHKGLPKKSFGGVQPTNEEQV